MGDWITVTQGLLENISIAQNTGTSWDDSDWITVRTGTGFAFWLQFTGGNISINLRISPIYPRGGTIVSPDSFYYEISDLFASVAAPASNVCLWAPAPTEINYPFAQIKAQAVEQNTGAVSGLWLFTTYNGE